MNALLVRIGIRPILWLLIVVSIAACALAWVGSVMFAKARIDRLVVRESAQAQSDAMLAGAHLDQKLIEARGIASTLSLDPAILMALSRFGPNIQASSLPLKERGDVWRADPLLTPIAMRMMQTVEKFELSTLWATNAAGDTIAEGHAPGVSPFTGTNYADRAYFKAAQNGMDGRQFAIGRVTNIYGLFLSSPAQIDGQFVGMIGVGLPVGKLLPSIDHLNKVVADDLGVIVLAKDPDLQMQAMPGAKVNALSTEEREKRYKRQKFVDVDLQPQTADFPQALFRWRGQDSYVMGSQQTGDGALRVYVLRDLAEAISQSQLDQWRWFVLVSALVLLSAALVAGSAQFFITTQRQQIALQEANQTLSRQANTDVLTGCANRRYFIQVLEQERQRADRYGTDFCVLSMDIDHFKHVNDTYGHAAGDEVLKHFVTTIQGKLRDTDVLGRLGGEEFSILLPQTSAENGEMMAERIRAAVEASPAIFGTVNIAITVSIGGAQWSSGKNHLLDEFLARTDEAMYAAKNTGRNRVKWAMLPTDSASAVAAANS